MDSELERWKSRGQYFDYLGFNVFYRIDGSGPPLLLIHGYPFNSWDWAPIWPELVQRFTVIAPDMLGMGFSDKPFGYGYSVLDHADMHEALLAELGLRHCHILAHDLGNSVAQELLTRHDDGRQSQGPMRIDTLTWLNGGLFNEAYRPRPIQTLLSQTPFGAVASRFRRVLLSSHALDRSIDELFGADTKPSRAMRRQFNEILEYNDGKRVTHKVGGFVKDLWCTAIDGFDPCGKHLCRFGSSTALPIPTRAATWPRATGRSFPTRMWCCSTTTSATGPRSKRPTRC